MTTEAAQELTPQQIWDEEVKVRESATANAAAEASLPFTEQPATEASTASSTTDNSSAPATGADKANTSGSDAAADATANEPDVMAQILDKLTKLEGRQRNVEGHIGGLKTAQHALHAAMEQARSVTTKGEAEAPSKGQVAAAATNPEKWDSLKKDFPEWAEATEELLGSRLAALSAPNGSVNPEEMDKLVNQRVQQATSSLRQELIDSHLDGVLDGWKDEVKTDKFGTWLQAQPKDVQALAGSADVRDAARMLRLYGAAKKADPSTAIQQDRQQKLAQATALPKSRTTPQTKTLDQMTDQEVWEYEAKKREQERVKRGY